MADMKDYTLSVAEAGMAAIREAESKAGAAFRLLVEENDALRARAEKAKAERDRMREALEQAEPYLETLHSLTPAEGTARKLVWGVVKRVRAALSTDQQEK